MNEKEVAEIRRRFRKDKSNITHIRGCYVNENQEIVARFDQSLAMMSEEETDTFLSILKRTLSGSLGKNLIDLAFDTQQVVNSEEHRLLMALRDSSLKDEEAVDTFFQKVIQSAALEGNYLILLAHDTYDVPYRSKDGDTQADASSEVFSYILCSVCPIKLTKPALSYYVAENAFHNRTSDWLVSTPELGFIFPSFDDRSTNLYNTLYYTRNSAENHASFVEAVFSRTLPMPADEQKEAFQSILEETLEDDCSFDAVQAVHEQIRDLIEAHKLNKEEEPLVMTKDMVRQILGSCGVNETQMALFDTKFDTHFGSDTQLPPQNLVDPKRFEVRTPNVTIRVNPERGDLVETRVINGVKYILIRADEGVEVNGVNIHIP
ncbi:DUF4317 domain-containing protein [Pseudoflavonifractor sp. DSM 107456]|uniref:DUF4317 domain-containing protein n=1 Tax=Pseudoflavonifractor gallinarum TaxID=2779352 RepID=A0ABR9RAM2_9FIRM|nr:DUF4317 domain-containing protein [Pseudoflavonifractor gallinarum]MBE5055727.1 DUF4317 domain-containing protein [Pseudoflavonifractor gallinarum]